MQPEQLKDVDVEDFRNYQVDVYNTPITVFVHHLPCKGTTYSTKAGFTMVKVLKDLLSLAYGSL